MKEFVLCVLIILSLFITSCGSDDFSNEDAPTLSGIPAPTQIQSAAPVEIRILDTNTSKETPYPDWNEYLKENFNLTLQYTYNRQVTSDLISSFDGIVLLQSRVYAGLILENPTVMLEMQSHLDSISAYTALPDYIAEAYMTSDGILRSIIISEEANDPLLLLRQYNRQINNSVKDHVPETTDELMELMLTVKTSGKTPMRVSKKSILMGLMDVLGAYGMSNYLENSEYFSPVQYSYADSHYCDIAVTSNMQDALGYIRQLMDTDLLELSQLSYQGIYKQFVSGDVFSVYDRFAYFPDDDTPAFDMSFGYYLQSNDYSPGRIHSELPVMVGVLGGKTEDSGTMIASFVSAFYSDNDALIGASLGVNSSDSYTFENDRIIMNEKNPRSYAGQYVPVYLPNLINEDVVYKSLKDDEFLALRNIVENENRRVLSDAGICKPYDYYHLLYNKQFDKAVAGRLLNKYILTYLTEDISYQDFLSEYTAFMKSVGIDDAINILNQKLGMADFNYD